MKSRITIISIVLNIVLAGAIFFVMRKSSEKFAIRSVSEVSNVAPAKIVQARTQTNFIPPAAPVPFNWSQIESKGFLIYAANLRGIGCPEETVRDILTAEINDLFVYRRQNLLRPLQSQFWDLMARGGENNLIPKETKEKLDALDAEKEMLLKKVFRAGISEEKNHSPSEYESLLTGFLSVEKVEQFRNISEKFDKQREKLQSSELPEAEKQKQHALLRQQLVAEQTGLLSPEEMEEFKLRKSSFAQQLQNLPGFQASEEELRAMARLTMNEKSVPTDKKAPNFEAKLAEQRAEKRKIDQRMTELLGQNRFEEYERSKHFIFRNLTQVGRRYDLSPQTIAEVYELERSTLSEVRAFRKSNAHSEEREEALETIRREMEQAVSAKLGMRAAETYWRNFGSWDEIPDP